MVEVRQEEYNLQQIQMKHVMFSSKILGSTVKGELVEMVLVEEKLSIESEFYVSVVLDRSAKKTTHHGQQFRVVWK